jgi:hypothetical protein
MILLALLMLASLAIPTALGVFYYYRQRCAPLDAGLLTLVFGLVGCGTFLVTFLAMAAFYLFVIQRSTEPGPPLAFFVVLTCSGAAGLLAAIIVSGLVENRLDRRRDAKRVQNF